LKKIGPPNGLHKSNRSFRTPSCIYAVRRVKPFEATYNKVTAECLIVSSAAS